MSDINIEKEILQYIKEVPNASIPLLQRKFKVSFQCAKDILNKATGHS